MTKQFYISGFPSDTQHSNQDHLYENRYTTERATRRPDLDFDDDWASPKPVTSSRYPSAGDSYKPPVQQKPDGYSSHEQGEGYNSYTNTGSDTYNHEQSGSSGYSNTQGSSGSGGSVYSSHRETKRTTTDGYNSHETYHENQKPFDSSGGSGYSNFTRPSSGNHQSSQNNPRPLVTQNTDYIPQRPSISININKDVTYNVDMPDTMNYNHGTSGSNRPSSDRETPNVNSQYPKTTERYNSHNSDGIRDDTYSKTKTTTTTKKPIVINSININIHSSDSETQSQVSSYVPSQPKPTTRRPQISSNKNSSSSSSSRQTTRRPSSSHSSVTQRPSSSNGYQSGSPNKNPDISSSETHYQPGYGQTNYNEESTTAKNQYGTNQESGNHRPSSSEFAENSRPNPIPSSRPSSDAGNKKIPKPQTTGSKHG